MIAVRASTIACGNLKLPKVLKDEGNGSNEDSLICEDGVDDEDVEGDDDDGPDEDVIDLARDPPEGCVRLRPSQYLGLPSTVYFEYPRELNIRRNDEYVLEKLGQRKMLFKCAWERICIKNAFTRAGYSRVDGPDGNKKELKYWTATWGKHQNSSQIKALNCLQKVNHFPASWCVGRKDRLVRSIAAMKRTHGSEFDIHPESYILPSEREAFLRAVRMDVQTAKGRGGPVRKSTIEKASLWIVKPVASSCGRGIKVITSSQALAIGKNKKALLQRYLSHPYLIDGRKFDLRLYVLVSGVDPMRVYVHTEGLTRISTNKYSLNNTSDRFAHLTNYSINKKASSFRAASLSSVQNASVANGDAAAGGAAATIMDENGEAPSSAGPGGGNVDQEAFKWSLGSFKQWLAQREGKAVVVETFRKINDLLVKTMIAAESEITPKLHADANYRSNCYELFGCDVILDKNLNPSLLEVNVSPSLMGSSPLDKRIKGIVMADTFHTVGLYPYDAKVLRKFDTEKGGDEVPTFGKEDVTGRRGEGNPFTFQSLGKMMASQDKWRKNPDPSSIDFAALSPAWNKYIKSNESGRRRSSVRGNTEDTDMTRRTKQEDNGSTAPAPVASKAPSVPHSAPWVMLLLADDEFKRANATRFVCLHPSPSRAEHYVKLYRMARFSDHLLARWVALGGSHGKLRRFIPARYLTAEARSKQEEELERDRESRRFRSSSLGRTGASRRESSAQLMHRAAGRHRDENGAVTDYRRLPRPLSSGGLYLGSGRGRGLTEEEMYSGVPSDEASPQPRAGAGVQQSLPQQMQPPQQPVGEVTGIRADGTPGTPTRLRSGVQKSSRDAARRFLEHTAAKDSELQHQVHPPSSLMPDGSQSSILVDAGEKKPRTMAAALEVSPVARHKGAMGGDTAGLESPRGSHTGMLRTSGGTGLTALRPRSAGTTIRVASRTVDAVSASELDETEEGGDNEVGTVVPRPPSGRLSGASRFSRVSPSTLPARGRPMSPSAMVLDSLGVQGGSVPVEPGAVIKSTRPSATFHAEGGGAKNTSAPDKSAATAARNSFTLELIQKATAAVKDTARVLWGAKGGSGGDTTALGGAEQRHGKEPTGVTFQAAKRHSRDALGSERASGTIYASQGSHGDGSAPTGGSSSSSDLRSRLQEEWHAKGGASNSNTPFGTAHTLHDLAYGDLDFTDATQFDENDPAGYRSISGAIRPTVAGAEGRRLSGPPGHEPSDAHLGRSDATGPRMSPIIPLDEGDGGGSEPSMNYQRVSGSEKKSSLKGESAGASGHGAAPIPMAEKPLGNAMSVSMRLTL